LVCRKHDHARVVVAEVPERRTVGISGRAAEQVERSLHLTLEDRDAIRSLAETRSLRELAIEYCVSHESVRRTLCRDHAWT
jgi:hypothetical protein